MTTGNDGLTLQQRDIGDFRDVPTLVWSGEGALLAQALGIIGNSAPTSQTGKSVLANWRIQVASRIKEARGERPWNPADSYAVTIGFSFHLPSHGNQTLDAENFVKPTVDALAAGLFCAPQVNPRNIPRWNYDDSGFTTLLIHRLPDAPTREAEGAAIAVSAQRRG